MGGATRGRGQRTGNGIALFRNVFLLGALVTALLSLDTTAVILTPIALSFVARLKLSPRPFLVACAFVANAGSLLLPVSNLTNLLFVHAFHWSFGAFALRMVLPQAAALLAGYGAFRWLFRRELPSRFDPNELPEPKEALPDIPYFRGAVVVLIAVLVGYFVGSLRQIPPYQVGLCGCAALSFWAMIRGQWKPHKLAQEISWSLFPVCGRAVYRGSRRGKSGIGGGAGAGLADGGNVAAGADFDFRVRRGNRLECREQYPRRAAFDFRIAGGKRGRRGAVRRIAWLQHRAEFDGRRFARHDAGSDDGAAQRNRNPGWRFYESGTARHAAYFAGGGAGPLADLRALALKFVR